MLVVRSHRSHVDTDNHILVLGLGYTGCALVNYLAHRKPEWAVTGTTRGNRKHIQFPIHDGVRVLEDVDFRQDSVVSWDMRECDTVTHIVSTIPPARIGCHDPVLENIVQHRSTVFSLVEWMGYISTTSIYGDHQGSQVWEDSEVKQRPSGRYDAEQEWLNHVEAHIFRCGGIYGPYRNVLSSVRASLKDPMRLLSKSQLARRRQSVTFRCHVYDVCQSIEHSMEKPHPGSIYNIVDDDPSGRLDVEDYAYITYFRMSPPVRDPEPLLPAEKIVMNTKIKQELNVTLQYPTYKQGLDALVFQHDLRPFTFI